MYRCVEKIRNSRGITELYHLKDITGTREDVVLSKTELKNLLIVNAIQVDNIKLTSDYKIIDKKIEERVEAVVEYSHSMAVIRWSLVFTQKRGSPKCKTNMCPTI